MFWWVKIVLEPSNWKEAALWNIIHDKKSKPNQDKFLTWNKNTLNEKEDGLIQLFISSKYFIQIKK